MGMLEEFVKLESYDDNQCVYIRPQDIVALGHDRESSRTKVTTIHGGIEHQTTVKEAPGVICDMCDKVMNKKMADSITACPSYYLT